MSRKFEIYSSRRLVEETLNAFSTPLLWDPEWPLSRLVNPFEALIPRLGTFQFPQALTSLATLETHTELVLNSSQAYRRARNKWSSYTAFRENHIATPDSQLVSKGDTPLWSKEFPCIVKDLEASKGEGVFLAKTPQDLQRLGQERQTAYLLQEAFPEAFGEDLRVFIVNGKVVAQMKRKSTRDFRSNLSLGGQGEVCSLTSEEEDLALRATSALQLKIAGVDILRTHKGSLVLEANPCPGLEGIEKVTGVNVARAIIEYIKETA